MIQVLQHKQKPTYEKDVNQLMWEVNKIQDDYILILNYFSLSSDKPIFYRIAKFGSLQDYGEVRHDCEKGLCFNF